MKSWLVERESGEVVRVLISSTRYGRVVVEGPIFENSAGEFVLAGEPLAGAVKVEPRTDPAVPVRVPSEGLKAVDVAPVDLPGRDVGIAEIRHGDLVRVNLTQAPFGAFTLVGVVTEGKSDPFLLVGQWIVRNGDQIAPRVTSIELLHENGAHEVDVPAIRALIDSLSVGD